MTENTPKLTGILFARIPVNKHANFHLTVVERFIVVDHIL